MRLPGLATSASSRLAVVALLAGVSTTLCGCEVPRVEGYFNGFDLDLDIPTHRLPFWRLVRDYCLRSAYKDPATHQPRWNSCMNEDLSALETCSQHGHCMPFDESEVMTPIFFCRCDQDWCGLECETRRLSQSNVFIISVLFGVTGADEYYMGNLHEALLKLVLFVLGVFVWFFKRLFHAMRFAGLDMHAVHEALWTLLIFGPWLYDVVRIGSAPVNTVRCPLAPDLPRWAFTSFTIMAVSFHALFHGIIVMYWTVIGKRRTWDDARHNKRTAEEIQYGTIDF